MPPLKLVRPEAAIQREVLLALARLGCMVWRSNTGMAYPVSEIKHTSHPPRPVMYGVPGQPDIIGVAPGGRALAVEVKTARGKQSDQQRLFQRAWEACGGLYLLVRSVDDAKIPSGVHGTFACGGNSSNRQCGHPSAGDI